MTAARLAPGDVDDAAYKAVHVPGDGPHDVDDLDPEVTLAAGTVDFGAVQVPLPERGSVAVDPSEKGRMQAVHIAVPEGRLSVSALAAPRSSRLWPDLAREIDASLREGGARVRSFQGDWGRELHATSGAATSLFVGVDGPRWMLYGVATGPTRDAGALDVLLRRMLRGTIVVRGRSPYPVRTVLPLEVPGHLAAAAGPDPEEGGSVVELRPSADAGHRSAPTAAYPAEPAPTPPTTALPLAPPHGTGSARPLAAPWSDPVHRIADGRPSPLDVDPDDRPTDVGPAAAPTERWRAAGRPGGPETAPWPPGSPPLPSPGGRRRLREPGADLPVSPGLTGPWAAWPESPTGSGRAVGPGPRPAGPTAFPAGGRPGVAGRRGEGAPVAGERVEPRPARSGAVVPDVLRVGRHAAADLSPERNGGAGVVRAVRAAGTRPWAAPRASQPDTAPVPLVQTATWDAVAAPASGEVTEPLPVSRPEPRPTGRHHRPD